MYKYLISGGRNTDSGPGNQELINGDETDGYYGTISSDEFLTGTEISHMVNFSQGYLRNDQLTWLKFSIDGKVLFTPLEIVRASIGWEAIYSIGCVYGVDGYGPFPVGNKVNQLTIINVGSHRFIVRLFKGVNANPIPNVNSSPNPPETFGSEWNRLMYRVVQENPFGIEDNWETFNFNYMTGSDYTVCQETLTPSMKIVVRGVAGSTNSVSGLHSGPPDQRYSNYCWRPVLELIQ